ncbi:MAG: KamA family radical SAM protein [Spirochaetales bacterium]|nr:KamA family radical SAM protein [Spirochaetales bacterium]
MEANFIVTDEAEPPASRTEETGHPVQPGKSVIKSFRVQEQHKNDYNKTNIAFKYQHDTPKLNNQTTVFLSLFFPGATVQQWYDWRWQIKNTIRDYKRLSEILILSAEEQRVLEEVADKRPLAITPYYLSLLWAAPENKNLRKTVIPWIDEYRKAPCEEDDPLHEDNDSPVPGLVHRYPDRVLFLVTEFCSTLCRYCTRSRIVIKDNVRSCNGSHWQHALDYIAMHKEIRDVLISGGDPLTLSDSKLEWLLSRLRKIEHVEIIRIGSKVPAVLPMRITDNLVQMLRKYHPLFISLHFAHPSELSDETAEACEKLADAGIPLGSQTVLLAGVNDNPETMKKLMQGLLKIRVRPYYLYQCDPVAGTSHFRTAVAKGIEIIENLRGHTSGYAVPNFVIDAPKGGGKIPLLPDYNHGHRRGLLKLRNYENRMFYYPDLAGKG